MNWFSGFWITIKRYTASAALNIFGLSIAFAAFIVLLIQVNFERGYDSYNKNADKVYRVALSISGFEGYSSLSCLSQQIIDLLSASSPHVKAATMLDYTDWSKDIHIKIVRADGAANIFKTDLSIVYPSFIKIADLHIIDGDKNVLSKPWNMLVPESIAKKMYPDDSAVGKSFVIEDTPYRNMNGKSFTIGAVYKDIPANSVLSNRFYYTWPVENKFGPEQYNFLFLVMLDSPANKAKVEKIFNNVLKEYYKNERKDNPVDIKLSPIRSLYYDNTSFSDFDDKGSKKNTDIMLAIAILIITMAIINYLNFAFAIAPLKMKMLNIRRIMGADRWHLRVSIIMESVMISVLSYAIAIFLVWSLYSTSFANIWIAGISIPDNLLTVGLSAVIAVIVGVLAGIYPAFYMTSTSPVMAMKGSFIMSTKKSIYRVLLIGFQYVISIVMIIVAAFITIQNRYITNYNLGYDKNDVVVAEISRSLYKKHESLSAELKKCSTIEDVAYAESKIGERDFYQNWAGQFNNEPADFNLMNVSYNFLDVLGIPVVEGRNFNKDDEKSFDGFMIFNKISPKTNGNTLNIGDGNIDHNLSEGYGFPVYQYKVIGFFDNSVHLQSMFTGEKSFTFYYRKRYSDALSLKYAYIKLKHGADKANVIDHIKSVFKSMDPTLPFEAEFLDEQLNHIYDKEQRIGYLTSIASLLAIIISLMGVFGLVMFETQYRRSEIGIRRVYGALIKEILAMFNRKFVIISFVCFIIAAPVAWYITDKWLTKFEYRIPIYWWVFVLALLVILIITISTVTIRSWSTANENPADSIKQNK